MARLPVFRARARPAVGVAADFRRMRGVNAAEHRPLAHELVVVFLGLGIEARVMIGIPRECGGSRSGRRTQDRLVNPSDPAGVCVPAPCIVALAGISIAPADESDAPNLLGGKHWIQAKQP